jgi:hypothetical protein
MSDQTQLFDVAIVEPGICRYPMVAPSTGYRYGCRCSRCRAAKKQRGTTPSCHVDGCDKPRLKSRRYCETHAPRCNEPGCTNLRRGQSGSRYCDEHARTINYLVHGLRTVPVRCEGCGKSFTSGRAARSETATAWADFCPNCHNATPLTLRQLAAQAAPAELVRSWLALGDRLPCGICGRRLTRRSLSSQPVIDHDHTCCGRRSCGACIRGVLCQRCNTMIGYVEAIMSQGLGEAVMSYLEPRASTTDARQQGPGFLQAAVAR